jgi:hypothetical protein
MDDGETRLGACCVCGGFNMVQNIVLLGRAAPRPGTGWGCVACGLPQDGAIAVMCDGCYGMEPRFVVDGEVTSPARIGVDAYLMVPFRHFCNVRD